MSQTYYWIKATVRNPNTGVFKTMLVRPKGAAALTESAAYQWGFSKFSGNFEVIALPTRDTGRASQMIKGETLDSTEDPQQALTRYGHKV